MHRLHHQSAKRTYRRAALRPLSADAVLRRPNWHLLMNILGRFGITAFALSELDIALRDIAGNTAGKPLSALLGATKREHLECLPGVRQAGLGQGRDRVLSHK
jgi:L-alanine-DL-glutamate epimerase-like enolase superfamily enzyme